MRKAYYLIILVLLVVLANNIEIFAKTNFNIPLNSQWYLNVGGDEKVWDPIEFKYYKDFDDKDMQNKLIVFKSEAMVPNTFQNVNLVISLQQLTNGHKVYFNDVLIGATELFPNHDFDDKNNLYYYFIPKSLINYGEKNTLKIKSFSTFEYGADIKPYICRYDQDFMLNLRKLELAKNITLALNTIFVLWGIVFIIFYLRSKIRKENFYFGWILIFMANYYSHRYVNILNVSYINYEKIKFVCLSLSVIISLPFLLNLIKLKVNRMDKIVLYLSLIFSMSIIIVSGNDGIKFFHLKEIQLAWFILVITYEMATIWIKLRKTKRRVFEQLFILATMVLVTDIILQIEGLALPYGIEFNEILLIVMLIYLGYINISDNVGIYKKSITDGLTNMYNKTFFINSLQYFLVNEKEEFALMIFDIDDFKKVNDTYGHPIGDRVLSSIAGAIKEMVPRGSISARYGGEEFMVLLKGIKEEKAFDIAESIRKNVENTSIVDYDSNHNRINISITISGGIVSGTTLDINIRNKNNIDFNKIINMADKQLYIAKKKGKNRNDAINFHGKMEL
ncbi:GGDEF domain-containing protein [Clostridium grantii]|uniref:Diguanylate cyclase (GGDEF) domain-containing protein n=1 Tax=Clostridium grantii DSM 8605 TaxID=1121316 RepID=A0A1M5ULU6_9CLOT|nr:GGDEF domain-containing protein [Clostridium grantii]SHH63974.1 diguanylate cyclase (GGDEF) domain-containing protein [Clostridium grantii DSM 8605]